MNLNRDQITGEFQKLQKIMQNLMNEVYKPNVKEYFDNIAKMAVDVIMSIVNPETAPMFTISGISEAYQSIK